MFNPFKALEDKKPKSKIDEILEYQKMEEKKMARNLVTESKEKKTEVKKPELDFPAPETKELMVILSGNEQFILNEIITRLDKLDQKVEKGFKAVGVESLD